MSVNLSVKAFCNGHITAVELPKLCFLIPEWRPLVGRYGKPSHRPERLYNDEYSIVAQYQAEYRGFASIT